MHAPSLFAALAVALYGSTAMAAPELDVVGSDLGDELGAPVRALAVDPDGNVVLGGSARGSSTLLRIDPAGLAVGATRRLAGSIDALAIDPSSGNVVVLGDGELRVLGPDLEPSWQRTLAQPPAAGVRLALGELGTIAIAQGDVVEVIAPDGRALGRVEGDERIAALAVLDADDLVVTTGTTVTQGCDDDVELASLIGYSRGGVQRWSAYGDAASECASATTRGIDVARGDDGMVYLLAEVEDGRDPFAGTAEHPVHNVAFDASSARPHLRSSLLAYYARFSPAGEHVVGQYLGFADELSVVQPGAIAADVDGNVHVTGVTTHSIAEPDEVAGESEIIDALFEPSGFYQVIASDFDARLAWRQLDLDDGAAQVAALALTAAGSVTLLQRSSTRSRAVGAPEIVAWPDPSAAPGKRPDREDVGTFGYESGVSGVDPKCYCDANQRNSPLGWAGVVVCIMLARPRRRARG